MSYPAPSDHHDVISTNRTFFDTLASKYDTRPLVQEISSKIADTFLGEYDFNDERTRVLDFACGTGLISRHLSPHALQIIGIDISQEMVNEFNRRVVNQGIPAEDMHSVCLDLLKDADSEGGVKEEVLDLLGGRFDVVVCSMSYHHLPSIPSTTRTLASLLNPGGKLLIADLYKDVNVDDTDLSSSAPNSSHHHPDAHHPSCPHPHNHSDHSLLVPHTHGLTVTSLHAAFESAGLKEVDVRKRIRVRGNRKGAGKEKEERYIVVASGLKV